MKILGISGLPNDVAFKKKHFPYLEKRKYRIAQGFDSASALLINNKIVSAASEERFSREKATERFPAQAIQYCLKHAKLALQDIDFIAHGFNYEPLRYYYEVDQFDRVRFNETYSRDSLLCCLQQIFDYPEQKFIQVPHHLAHAASVWYLSGMEESLILIADGMGEKESLTVALGQEKKIEILAQIPALHSLGILYSIFTLYLGFEFNQDEYKVMGLAPYGNRIKYLKEVMQLIHLKDNGTFTIPVLSCNLNLEEKETYAGTLKILTNLFGNGREPRTEITQHHMDIAAALQATLETVLIHVLKYFKQKTSQTNLCMAGGVALNCTANSYIRKSCLFKKIFIQPAAGDEGTALGAALYVARSHQPDLVFEKLQMPFLGPQFDNHEIKEVISQCGYQIKEYSDFSSLALEIAERIIQGQIIALFQGRMEFGPRALGNRSILADPRVATMREKINRIIKQREDFRPFAPAVIAEQASQFFDLDEKNILEYKYMLMVASVKTNYKEILPAVTHVDGSARVQVVFRSECLRFWQIINEFGKKTGIPVLLNTSFNVRGQPIVAAPLEAIQTFKRTDLDVLVIENFLIEK